MQQDFLSTGLLSYCAFGYITSGAMRPPVKLQPDMKEDVFRYYMHTVVDALYSIGAHVGLGLLR